MSSASSGSSGDPRVLRPALRAAPERVEPGLRFLPDRLRLDGAGELPLVGEDLLGRPVLVLGPEDSEHLPDRALRAVAALRQGEGDAARLSFPERARVIFLLLELDRSLQARLELLNEAFPVRAFQVMEEAAPAGSEVPALRLSLAWPPASPGLEDCLFGLPEGSARLARRLLLSARALRPPLRLLASPWPLLLADAEGLLASLYAEGEKLVFACRGTGDTPPLGIYDDEDLDLAVDRILRAQRAGSSSGFSA